MLSKLTKEPPRRIAGVAFVPLFVPGEPVAIVVLAQLAEERQRRRREIRHQRRLRSSLPGLKRIVFPGGIFTSTPVFGLRPMPFLRCLTWKTPNPRSSMRWPRASALRRPSMTVSTACAALTREISDISATLLTMSALIMMHDYSQKDLGLRTQDLVPRTPPKHRWVVGLSPKS